MVALGLQSVGLAFAGQEPLFDDTSLVFTPGWTGLTGRNGAGKTTLLRLLAGELGPDRGQVRRQPSDLVIALCRQDVEPLDDGTTWFAWSDDALARRLRGRLHLDPDALERWPTLSPGERRRWQLGAALALEPGALLLDEPTNHVDAEARDWLVDALRGFAGIGVMVSHDRALLDALTTRTVRVGDGRVSVKPLPYSAAHAEWSRERRAAADERRQLEAAALALQRRLGEQRRERDAMQQQRSAARRSRGRHDADARSVGAQTLADWAEARQSRQVAITRRALERARAAVPPGQREVELGGSVFARWQRPGQPVLAHLDEARIEVGERVLLRDVHLAWRRDDRIVVTGANGAGKSTLLGQLVARATSPGERLLVLPQELSADERLRDLAALRGLDPAARGRVLQVVAALGVAPEQLLGSGSPSPGEARKLRLALGLGRDAAGLVLDEPTNHLDLPSIERLEAALAAFPGALLMVSHDAALAARVAHTEWHLAGGHVEVRSLPELDSGAPARARPARRGAG